MQFNDYIASKIYEAWGPITDETGCEVEVLPFVELKGDDLYLVSPSSQNRWYGLASNGQSIVNASTVNGVAIEINTDILLIDEFFGAGDQKFKDKSKKSLNLK